SFLLELPHHFPFVLESDNLKWGSVPFRINNCFLEEKKFSNKVTNWWEDTSQAGYPGYAFTRRLKQLSSSIKSWQLELKASNKRNLESIKAEINGLDMMEAQFTLTEVDSNIEGNL
ncbi:hypothetical protein Csa_023980, partial [Cucumis sativus]